MPLKTGRRGQERLLRERLQRWYMNWKFTPREGSKKKKEKQYFPPHPNLSSGVAQNLIVSDVVEVAFSSFTLKD